MGLHRIRLAAPWEAGHRTASNAETAGAVSANLKLPLALNDPVLAEASSDSETLRLTRKFHCPTGINASTRLFIEIELAEIVASEVLKAVVLNGECLSFTSNSTDSDRLLHVDVSERLKAFNVLQLQFPLSASHTSGRLLSVTLLIEEQVSA